VQDVGLLNRYYNIPLAQEDLDEKRGFFSDCRETLKRLDFGAMGQAARIDYLLFKNQLAYELRKLACQEQRNQEVAELLPFGTTIAELEQQRRRLEPIDPSAIAAQLTQLAAQIEQAREAMVARLGTEGDAGAEEVSKSLANRAATLIDDLRKMLKNWFEFYNDYDPLFTWWAREPYQKSDTALENYASFLREKLVGIKEGEDAPIIGDPVGREALLNELDRAMIPYTPEELVAIAEREFAWCEEEMIRASRELGYGDEWQKAVEHIKRDHVAPGEQPALVKGLALEAIEFLEEHDLVTVPPLARQMWKVEMISPERQKVNPFFMGGETIHVSFPTSAMTHEQKLMSLRGNNVHFARATVHHELIPGHHLQGFTAKRHRPYRRVFTTPFFFEGWALHWEMLLWDLGFARSPENRLGMLFWRMYRCARIIFSLHFHLRKMTPQECIDFVVRRVGHEPANAAAEVRRSCGDDYAPLYQCAYMIGGLQIRALHRELVASGRMTHRQFHDALLRENAIPVEMARASLTNQHLGEDFRSRWRFAGDDFGEA
jgi:uncharacterized protein (DUF885 family)